MGIILAVIIARIPPFVPFPITIGRLQENRLAEDLPQEKGVLSYALESSCKRASEFHADTVLVSGLEVMMGTLFDLIPIVASWGVVELWQSLLTHLSLTGFPIPWDCISSSSE